MGAAPGGRLVAPAGRLARRPPRSRRASGSRLPDERQRLEDRAGFAARVDRLGDRDDRLRSVGLGLRGDERLAEIALKTQQRVERNLAEQRHVELRRERLATAGAEDLA